MQPSHTDVPVTAELHLPSSCERISQILVRIGDKWTVLVVMLLGAGPMRFNELKRTIGGVSQRMLTLTLRGLERDGLVTRTVYPTNPPRVDYALTPLGQSLRAPVEALGQWANAHQEAVESSRQAFDRRGAAADAPSPPAPARSAPSLRSVR